MSKMDVRVQNRALANDYDFLRALVRVSAGGWLVACCHPTKEQHALRQLTERGLLAYLPMRPGRRRQPRCKKMIDNSQPLIRGYLFVCTDFSTGSVVDEILSCGCVSGLLSFRADKYPHRVPSARVVDIIDHCEQLQTGGKPQKAIGFDIGSKVRLIAGPMEGFSAVVTGYDLAKARVQAEVKGECVSMPVNVPVDICREA
ncbi:putative transcription termination factor NusG [Roseibium sp. TrichSKD4]|uniref:transcription termination/antitermination NusG family protein n=1 Tax=Roseibium sp. TrichSKD4 TaxID=744980 RepID=UPI0001E56B0F|nr:transcription termination/antitermination NusG family protein [Roseibium sp. TrichSKD4]EFO32605.1 putative transcription termination factor NusG [Roseibium sp. TrichSKD4]